LAAGPEVISRPESYGFKVWLGYPKVMERPHQHTDIEQNFPLQSPMLYFMSGRFLLSPRGIISTLWAGVPHRLVNIAEGSACIWVTVPMAWFLGWGLSEGFTRSLLRGDLLVEPDRGARAGADERELLERWIADLESRDLERRKIVMLEVEARIRRLALSSVRQ